MALAFRKRSLRKPQDAAAAWSRIVDPDLFLAMENLELVAQGVVEGFMEGRHRSPFIGFSVEFDSHREYQRGDDIRSVNWKLWARQDRLYVKRFNADTNLNLHLLLDTSGSMGCAHGPSSKWRYAARAAAALAHLALKGRDAVGVTLLGEGVQDHLPPRTHPEQLQQIVARLANVETQGETALGKALDEAARLCHRRGLVMLFSDLLTGEDELFGALDQLRYHGHDVLIVHVLDPWERSLPMDGQFRFHDLETHAAITADVREVRERYAAVLAAWMDSLRTACEDRGVDWVSCTTADPLKDLLVDYLSKREQGMWQR